MKDGNNNRTLQIQNPSYTFLAGAIDEIELYSWVDGLAAEMIASTPKPIDFEWKLVTMGDEVWLTKYL